MLKVIPFGLYSKSYSKKYDLYLDKKNNTLIKTPNIKSNATELYEHFFTHEKMFYDWINKLDVNDAVFFQSLRDFSTYNTLTLFFDSNNINYNKQTVQLSDYEKQKIPPHTIVTNNTLFELLLNKKDLKIEQIYSICIQALYALNLMIKNNFYFLNFNSHNIGYKVVDQNKEINFEKTKIKSYGYQIYLIDYEDITYDKSLNSNNSALHTILNFNKFINETDNMKQYNTNLYDFIQFFCFDGNIYLSKLEISNMSYPFIHQKLNWIQNYDKNAWTEICKVYTSIHPYDIKKIKSLFVDNTTYLYDDHKNNYQTYHVGNELFQLYSIMFRQQYCQLILINYDPLLMDKHDILLIKQNYKHLDLVVECLCSKLNQTDNTFCLAKLAVLEDEEKKVSSWKLCNIL